MPSKSSVIRAGRKCPSMQKQRVQTTVLTPGVDAGNMKPPKYDLAAKQVKEVMDKRYGEAQCNY